MLYKNSESVNFDIDPCHDICTMYMCRCSCPSIPQRLRNQKKYPKKFHSGRPSLLFEGLPTGNKPIFCFGLIINVRRGHDTYCREYRGYGVYCREYRGHGAYCREYRGHGVYCREYMYL